MDDEEGYNVSRDILEYDQDDVCFTGERLVINKFVKQEFNDVLMEHLVRYELACRYANGRKVLDAACGSGYGTKMLKDSGAREAIGVDISQDSIDKAITAYKSDMMDFICGDVISLPFADGFFELMVSFETIEHIAYGENLIKEASRVLVDNGLFIVSTPNRSVTNPGIYIDEQPLNRHHKFEYSVTEFIGELFNYFDIIEIYGQNFIEDRLTYAVKAVRMARGLDENYTPRRSVALAKHCLMPLGDVKNASPEFVVAVCRKKDTVLR